MNSHLLQRKLPNSEQIKAIYHNGGKVLSAGAGSGKTFVIVEHLLFKISEFKKSTDHNLYNVQIPKFLNRIVLMTFTTKAAGEMSIRLIKRIEEIIEDTEDDQDKKFWMSILKNIGNLSISTIHGFCFKLIKAGYWENYSSSINLVNSFEHKNKIKKLVEEYFEINREKLDPLIRSSYLPFLNSMVDVFDSVELRLTWDEEEQIKNHNGLEAFFKSFIEVNSYQDVFEKNYDSCEVKKDHKVLAFLDSYYNFVEVEGICNDNNFEKYLEFFSNIETYPQNRNLPVEISEKYNRIKKFRDDLQDYSRELLAAISNDQYLISWEEALRELFKYISAAYIKDNNWNFSDLEYYVYKGLNDKEVIAKLRDAYDYFIVDEFQDTSFVQYEIIKRIIDNQMEKLFIVGDRKQAIYGFRGGEIQVFGEASSAVGNNNCLVLQNNFRSCANVIEFNNLLFHRIFPLGLGFSSIDRHAVHMESQKSANLEINGTVESLNVCFESEDKLNLNLLESRVLFQKILNLIEDESISSICILYRHLAPSSFLIEKLYEAQIQFKAQLKIKLQDDPVMVIFKLLVECALNKLDIHKFNSTKEIIANFLKGMGIEQITSTEIDEFFIDMSLYGIAIAFKKYIFSIGLSNSLYHINYPLIDSIIKISGENLDLIYSNINLSTDESYSIDSITGKMKKKILIMTAHASKGLEFDAVLLGGIYTNGTIKVSNNLIGKIPGSFQYKLNLLEKKYLRSPQFIIENLVSKHKDFSESKRLLYVACTRAIKYLGFANMSNLKKGKVEELKYGNNCWIVGLRMHLANNKNLRVEFEKSSNRKFNLKDKDWLGLKKSQESTQLVVLPELSVTRLATMYDCPFKFYLSSILKINTKNEINLFELGEEEFYSSKERGTEVHQILSDLICKKLDIKNLKHKDFDKINWAYQLFLNEKKSEDFFSERLLRFHFWGQMISGTPDLYFLNGSEIVIWDFKTGIRDEQKESSYWFQLYLYGIALEKLYSLGANISFKMALVYVDEFKIIDKYLTLNELKSELERKYKKVDDFSVTNHMHCIRCEYSGICNKKG